MQVQCNHHIDASDPDANGDYEYYYEYDIFLFSEGELTLQARTLEYKDLQRPLVQQAVDYLRNAGKTEVRWFNPQYARYEPV